MTWMLTYTGSHWSRQTSKLKPTPHHSFADWNQEKVPGRSAGDRTTLKVSVIADWRAVPSKSAGVYVAQKEGNSSNTGSPLEAWVTENE